MLHKLPSRSRATPVAELTKTGVRLAALADLPLDGKLDLDHAADVVDLENLSVRNFANACR